MALTFGNVRAADGTRIFYAMEPGEGVPLVSADPTFYLHASQQVRLDGDLATMQAIAAGQPWYLFDWRGKGMSEPGEISFRGLESDLEAILDLAGPVCDLYAWGDAVLIAASVAARRPQRIRRILFAGCVRYQRHNRFLSGLYEMLRAAPASAMATFVRGQHETMNAVQASAIGKEWAAKMPMENFERCYDVVREVDDLANVAHGISSPVMIVTQESGTDSANQAALVIPHAQVSIVPDLRSGRAQGESFRAAWNAHRPLEGPTSPGLRDARDHFTPREREVLRLLLRGLSNSEIASALVITDSTAKRHVANIFEKLGVHTRAQAIVAARSFDLDTAQ